MKMSLIHRHPSSGCQDAANQTSQPHQPVRAGMLSASISSSSLGTFGGKRGQTFLSLKCQHAAQTGGITLTLAYHHLALR